MILRWENVGSYVAFAREHSSAASYPARSESWDRGVSGARAMDLALTGDPETTAAIVTAHDAIETNAGDEARWSFESGPYGTRVDMGAYLAGQPYCMRRRVRRDAECMHVAIYVSIVMSAGINAAAMVKRGGAILGLLDALQAQGVSVDLYVVADMHGARRSGEILYKGKIDPSWDMTCDGNCTQVIRVDSRPLDLATSGFVLTHPAFARNVTYLVGARFGFNGNWSSRYNATNGHVNPDGYVSSLRRALGASERDLLIPPEHYLDRDMLTDPQSWIRRRLAQALGREQAA